MSIWKYDEEEIIDGIENSQDVVLYVKNLFDQIIGSLDKHEILFLEKYKNSKDVKNAIKDNISTVKIAYQSDFKTPNNDGTFSLKNIIKLLRDVNELNKALADEGYYYSLALINSLFENSVLKDYYNFDLSQSIEDIINHSLNNTDYETATFYLEKLPTNKKIKLVTDCVLDRFRSIYKRGDSRDIILFLLGKYNFFNDLRDSGNLVERLAYNITSFDKIIDLLIKTKENDINTDLINHLSYFYIINSWNSENNNNNISYLARLFENELFPNVKFRVFKSSDHASTVFEVIRKQPEYQKKILVLTKYLNKMTPSSKKDYIRFFLEDGDYNVVRAVIENNEIDPNMGFINFNNINFFLVDKIISNNNHTDSIINETINIALNKFSNDGYYKKHNLLTFCLDSLSWKNKEIFFPLIKNIIAARPHLVNQKDLSGRYPLDYVNDDGLRQYLNSLGCTEKNKTRSEKFVALVRAFLDWDTYRNGPIGKISPSQKAVDLFDNLYLNFNNSSNKIYDLVDDLPRETRIKIEKNILSAKEVINLIRSEKGINLYEEALILEKNAGRFTIKALENYNRTINLPEKKEKYLADLNEQIDLIAEQIQSIKQSVLTTIEKDIGRQAQINQEVIKKVNFGKN